eukprot:scaffold265645_cov23-Tisochrysis_lutea.AAC.2
MKTRKVIDRQPLSRPPRAASSPSCSSEYWAFRPTPLAMAGWSSASARKTCTNEPETVRAMSGSVHERNRTLRDGACGVPSAAHAVAHQPVPERWGRRPAASCGAPVGLPAGRGTAGMDGGGERAVRVRAVLHTRRRAERHRAAVPCER